MHVIRASELGSCLKALVATQLEYTPVDPPEWLQAAYDRGNAHEEECAVALRALDYEITGEQHELTLEVLDGWSVVGHVDGYIGGWGPAFCVWEAKAPNAWAKFHDAYKRNDWSDPLTHRYAWQISAYMHAAELEAMVTCLEDDEIKSFGIEIPPFSFEDIRARVEEVRLLAETGTLPAECSQRNTGCPFPYLHEDEELAEDPVLDQLVWNDNVFQRVIAEKTASRKENQQKIREHLDGMDRETTLSRVTFYSQKAPAKYDMDAIAKALKPGVTLGDFLIPGKSSERMKITMRDEDEPEASSD